MAEVRPFKGYRYTTDETDISTYCAPPYDVISEEQRDEYAAANPYNNVAIDLATGALDLKTPNNRYVTAASIWKDWREQGIVKQDGQEALYVIDQQFDVQGSIHCRTSFISEVKIHSFSERIILPHERTLPKALGDRWRLMQTTKANLSQVFSLFSEEGPEYAHIMAAVKMNAPTATATDKDGLVTRLWVVTDTELIGRFCEMLKDKKLIIADGHHRYTTALSYRDAYREERYGCMAEEAVHHEGFDPDDPHEFVMMALSNMDDPQLVVLPCHRVASAFDCLDGVAFTQVLTRYFNVVPVDDDTPMTTKVPAFLFYTRDAGLQFAQLRTDMDIDDVVDVSRSRAWKSLDVAVLQERVLGPLFSISPDNPDSLDRIRFSKDASEAISWVDEGTGDVAFIMRPTRMDQLHAVTQAGETMPQKSTYFYPKIPSGLVYRQIEEY